MMAIPSSASTSAICVSSRLTMNAIYVSQPKAVAELIQKAAKSHARMIN
jgi:hypothetical protein